MVHPPECVAGIAFGSVETRATALQGMAAAETTRGNPELHLQLGNAALREHRQYALSPKRTHQREKVAKERVVLRDVPSVPEQLTRPLAKGVEVRRKVVAEASVGMAKQRVARFRSQHSAVERVCHAAPAIERLKRLQERQSVQHSLAFHMDMQ